MLDIRELGFDEWFLERRNTNPPLHFQPARVTAVHRDNFTVRGEYGELSAEASGKFLFATESELDMPTVGDWVEVEYFNENTLAIIHELIPRKTLLKRKTAGDKKEYQLIAANIDIALIVQTCGEDFNTRRLERYLIAVRDGGVEPVLLLSKTDLVLKDKTEDLISEVRAVEPGLDILPFSNVDGNGLETIRGKIRKGRTYCLLGSSGVGKTTLVNSLLGEEVFYTKSIRARDEKGRHATSLRQLVLLKDGGMLVDTPGMRELGLIEADAGIQSSFPEIEELAMECRFNNCSHLEEDGCAVLKAVEDGSLSRDRYGSWLKLRRESAYNEMSYLEKRHRDKSFGKMVKSVMTHRKKNRNKMAD